MTDDTPTPTTPAAADTPSIPVGSSSSGNVSITAPTPAPATQSAVEQDAEKVVASLQDRLEAWLKGIYNQNKILFYTIIPLMGIIYLVIKYHNLLISILLGSAKQMDQQELQKDALLAQQAAKTTAAGDALVDQAKQAPSQEQPVSDDWYKK